MQSNTIKGWKPADEVWFQFTREHPEFGAKQTPGSWVHFQRVYAEKMIKADIIRRIPYRGRMLADSERFEMAAFNLLTTGDVNGRSNDGFNLASYQKEKGGAELILHALDLAIDFMAGFEDDPDEELTETMKTIRSAKTLIEGKHGVAPQ